MELRLGVAAFFKAFSKIEVAKEAAPDDLDVLNYFVIMHKGHQNLIHVVE